MSQVWLRFPRLTQGAHAVVMSPCHQPYKLAMSGPEALALTRSGVFVH